MLPDDVEYYVNDGIGLEVHHLAGTVRYWIKAGVGYLEFTEDGLKNLVDLLNAYDQEELRPDG